MHFHSVEQRGESTGFGKEMPEDMQCVCKLILVKSFFFNFLGKFSLVCQFGSSKTPSFHIETEVLGTLMESGKD